MRISTRTTRCRRWARRRAICLRPSSGWTNTAPAGALRRCANAWSARCTRPGGRARARCARISTGCSPSRRPRWRCSRRCATNGAGASNCNSSPSRRWTCSPTWPPAPALRPLAARARIAREVGRAAGVLGAFVYRNHGIAGKLGRLFALAQQHGLGLDLHVDEGLDPDACGLRSIAELVHARHFRQGVVCGHCCSLALQDEAVADATLALCAQAGIHIVALPTTNLYLQGAWERTPVPRGITRIREAAARGLRASLATDNVQDAFYPYGSYDLLETFGLGVQLAHLAPAIEWLDAITVSPAKALGLAWDGRLAPGCPADLVLLGASAEHELIGARGRRRSVIRAGQILEPTP